MRGIDKAEKNLAGARVCLILFLFLTQANALAPPPINFRREEVRVGRKTYVMLWDGEKLTITEKRGNAVIGLIILAVLVFWTPLIIIFLVKMGVLIEATICALVLILVLSVYFTLNKKRG